MDKSHFAPVAFEFIPVFNVTKAGRSNSLTFHGLNSSPKGDVSVPVRILCHLCHESSNLVRHGHGWTKPEFRYPEAPDQFTALKQPGFETPTHLRGNGGVGSSIESPGAPVNSGCANIPIPGQKNTP